MKLFLEPLGNRTYEVVRGLRLLGTVGHEGRNWAAWAPGRAGQRGMRLDGEFELCQHAISALDDLAAQRA